MFENNIVVYRFVQDLHFFVTGGDDENELILATVLQGFFDAVGLLLRSLLLFSCFYIMNSYFLLLRLLTFKLIPLTSMLACSCCRDNVHKQEALENLDLILLCLDEIVDGG